MRITKKLFIAVAAILSLGLISTPVWAGSKQQHRWEGVAIGVGAAILGNALVRHHTYGYPSGPPVAFSFSYRDDHRQPSRHHGYRKHHNGGHHTHWGAYDRGLPYKGYRQHGNVNGHRHKGKWQSNGREHHGDRRSDNRGHGGRRF